MAEAKKFDKKPAPPAPKPSGNVETLIGLVFILAIAGMIIERLYRALTTGNLSFFGFPLGGVETGFRSILPTLRVISYALSAAFAFGAIVLSQMRGTIWIAQKNKLFPEGDSVLAHGQVEEVNPMADKWKKVLEHIESEHPSDWRLAIIEADIMLAELLEKLNLPGETIGDKLKSVEKSDFNTLDFAWEAHKVRNKLAHEGSEFLLNQREARRVIDLYDQVFKEFYMT
ncbi:MAG TPA: hypothetical protein VJH67_02700 [Candidatus Paceibacterota bacterium]